MVVHLYGVICDMIALKKLSDTHGIAIVEDCAEAMGSTLNGQHVGTFGDVGTFSFFGNKTVTTGEGGMVVASDPKLATRMRKVKGQGQSFNRRYWHDEMGFNYRLTNICAAIGLAQMERIDFILARKRAISHYYRELLKDSGVEFQHHQDGLISSDWLVSLLLPINVDRDLSIQALYESGIDSRPVFFCAHQMPVYKSNETFPVSEEISRRGISLPSYPGLTDDDVRRVATTLKKIIVR